MSMENLTVLVIDDEAEIHEFLRFVLEREGASVLEACDGGQGMEIFGQKNVDVLITDLVMPEKEGIETIMRVKASRADLKIIAMSGALHNDMYLKIAESLGAHETLRKPFSRQQVLESIRRVMDS